LKELWLRETLGDAYAGYSDASDAAKTDVLTRLLRAVVDRNAKAGKR